MKTFKELFGFLTFLALVIASMIAGVVSYDPDSYVRAVKAAIKSCEKDLPRSQTCEVVITAVPKPKESND